MDDTRSLSGAASLGVNTLLLLAMAGSLSNLPWWSRSKPIQEPHWSGHPGGFAPLDLWQPFIDNPEEDETGPDCPGTRRAELRLLEAPLPQGFRTQPDGPGPHFACVRLDAAGGVRGVSLHGRSDAALRRMIRSDWRFSPSSSGGRGATEWHRVRLTRLPPIDH